MTRLPSVHPGEALKHDLMEPLGLSAAALAGAIGATPARDRGGDGAAAGAAFRHRCADPERGRGVLGMTRFWSLSVLVESLADGSTVARPSIRRWRACSG